jgi:hypothetical protein
MSVLVAAALHHHLRFSPNDMQGPHEQDRSFSISSIDI